MLDSKIIGENIKSYRTKAGLNQGQLARFLGLDQSMISKIEKGERKISLNLLERVSRLFCCPISVLINSKEEPKQQISFRSSAIQDEDLKIVEVINQIVLNQFEMDALARRETQDE